MRTVDYSEVLRGTAGLAGLLKDDVDNTDFALLRAFHDRRLQLAWEIHDWPDLVRTEQRWFREEYNNATAYTAPTAASATEVFYTPAQKYYQALRATTGNAPANSDGTTNTAFWADCAQSYSGDDWKASTVYAVGKIVRNTSDYRYYRCHTAHTSTASFDAAKFGILTPFDRYVGFEQTGKTKVGEFLRATHADPRMTTQLVEYCFTLSQNGAQLFEPGVVTVWIQFRIRRPELKGDKFSSTTVYASGLQVYYTTAAGVGNFYDVVTTTTAGDTPESQPSKFSKVELPYIFRGYLIQAGYADWLVSDGQDDKATKHEGMAFGFLELESDKLHRQQKQTRRLNYKH